MTLALHRAGRPSAWHTTSECRPRCRPDRRRARRVGTPAAAAAAAGGAAASDNAGGGVLPAFLQNPAIAQRELLRQFYMASTSEEQLRLLRQATGEALDLGSSLQMLCHTADLSLKGMLPGGVAEQGQLLRTLHGTIEPSLPSLEPLHLATALWAYAAVGVAGDWTDALLQQVAERELGLGAVRLQRYNTKELTSLLYAYGRLLRRCSPEVQQYGASLAGELVQRWDSLPYIKSSFSSADFADLAEACAALFGRGSRSSGASSSSPSSGPSSNSPDSSSSGSSGRDTSSGRDAGSSSISQAEPVPEEAAALLSHIAWEVRRQLANKHSLRSPWTPRDLVRLARAYAAVGHATQRTTQMLDVLSSFCVQRIRCRHLNCVNRPSDLTGLLEAYADLRHSTVAVPELLAAVGDQVRRGAAAAAVGTAAGGLAPAQPQQQQQQQWPQAGPIECFSLAGVTSLLDSHLRLGYAPPPLLLQCLAPQIRRQLPHSAAADVAALLQLLAAVPLSPGAAMVGLLLGRVMDEAGGKAAGGGELVAAAQQAADTLLLSDTRRS